MITLVIVFAIALQVFLTVKKVSPFLSLLLVSIICGLLLGMEPLQLVKSIEKGVGSTLGSLALVICLGAILGKLLETGGATEKISATLIGAFGEKNVQWAMLLTGFLIGLPLYYNAGFVILVPLVFSVAARTGLPLLYIAIPMAASLSTTHCFLPPHPGPVVLISSFGADTGKTLIYGICIAIPAVIIAGPLLGQILRKMEITHSHVEPVTTVRELPAALPSFVVALLPVGLITLSVIVEQFLPPQHIVRVITSFTGDAGIALFISVCVATYYFGIRQHKPMAEVTGWLNQAIASISVILLIITAGGVFKQVLIDSGTGEHIAAFSRTLDMPPLVFAWLITALLRVTLGSATVAGLTAAGIVAPLVGAGGVAPELMVLAVGAGSVFGSHINDSGFWMYKEFFKLNLKQTFLSWTVMETIISIIGLAGVLVLQLFVNPSI